MQSGGFEKFKPLHGKKSHKNKMSDARLNIYKYKSMHISTYKRNTIFLPPALSFAYIPPSPLTPTQYIPLCAGIWKNLWNLVNSWLRLALGARTQVPFLIFLSMIKGSENGISFLLVVGDQLRHKTIHILFTQRPIRTKGNSNLIVENN